MRYPWEFGTPPPDDQEGLQTDVMRFIAILGLCLAAIFSLVTAAEKEQSAAAPAVAATVAPAAVQTAASSAAAPAGVKTLPEKARWVSTEQPLQAQPVQEKPQEASQGFSLEFESVEALQQLLHNNRVELYVSRGETFWKLGPGGGFESSRAPARYYTMHTDTLPEKIRQASKALGALSQLAWGVTLPQATVRQIQQMTTTRTGGELVIRSDARVIWGLNQGGRGR